MKLVNRLTLAGCVLIAATALVLTGCGSETEDDTTGATPTEEGGEAAEEGGEVTVEEGGETAGKEEGGETAEEEGGETAEEEGGETAEEEGGETAEEEGGETAEEEGGEATEEEGGEATEEEGGEATEEEGGEATEEEGGEATEEEGGEEGGDLPTDCDGAGGILCPDAYMSTAEVEVLQEDSGVPAAFTGGDIPTGDFELTKVTLYPGSMTADQSALPVELSVTNNGTTGSGTFVDSAWAISADLNIAVSALGNDLALEESLLGGGCFVAEGNVLSGDVTQCSDSSGEESDFELPNSFQYTNADGTLELLLEFPVEALLAGLEGNPIAGVLAAVLVNDLQVVLTLVAVQ